MQCFFTSWNFPKCHSRKNFNCQVHHDMKLNAGLPGLDYKPIVTVRQFR